MTNTPNTATHTHTHTVSSIVVVIHHRQTIQKALNASIDGKWQDFIDLLWWRWRCRILCTTACIVQVENRCKTLSLANCMKATSQTDTYKDAYTRSTPVNLGTRNAHWNHFVIATEWIGMPLHCRHANTNISNQLSSTTKLYLINYVIQFNMTWYVSASGKCIEWRTYTWCGAHCSLLCNFKCYCPSQRIKCFQ